MKEDGFSNLNSQNCQNISQKKGWVNDSRSGIRNQMNQFSKYLSSEQSQVLSNPKEPYQSSPQVFQLEQKHYMACPELYESFRIEQCIEQIKGDSFKIQRYSKGRNELRFRDLIEVEIPNVAKLTVWQNGDYKLIYNEQVFFWHEEEQTLDKYCVTI